MRPTALQTLTWATMAAAVASATWLAAVAPDPGASLRLTALQAGLLPLARPNEHAVASATRRRNNEPAPPRRQGQR